METKYLTPTSKNQITLTREVRNALNLLPGDKVYFEITSEGVKLKKAELIEECPICNGEKKVLNNECLVCDGEGFIKEKLSDNSTATNFIINKLVYILLNNQVNIDIEPNEYSGHLIKSKSENAIVTEYLNRCQLFIVKEHLSSFRNSKTLISNDIKKHIKLLFDNTDYQNTISKLINEIQLDIVKSILKERETLSSEECSEFIDAFDEQYRKTVSNYLFSFVSL